MGSPQTQYARSGDLYIAYQVVGDGPSDLVLVPGLISHLEITWEVRPPIAKFYRQLSSFSRLILFDKRGSGLSDSSGEVSAFEDQMDDVKAVMDAAGSERAALFGTADGGPLACIFAATYPERTSALILYGAYAKRTWASDYPWAPTADFHENGTRDLRKKVGERAGRSWFCCPEPQGRRTLPSRLRPHPALRSKPRLGDGLVPIGVPNRRSRSSARDQGADADPA